MTFKYFSIAFQISQRLVGSLKFLELLKKKKADEKRISVLLIILMIDQ